MRLAEPIPRDSKAYQCRRWPLAGSRGEAPRLLLFLSSLTEVREDSRVQRNQALIKNYGKISWPRHKQHDLFSRSSRGAHSFPSSEKNAKRRGETALRRRLKDKPHHNAFGERFPNSAAHAASNRREGSLFALWVKKSPHGHALSDSSCRLGLSLRLRP